MAEKDYGRMPYARLLVPEDTGGYSAAMLEWPGCYAQGETAAEALQALTRAADAWVAAALAQGQTIPPPFHRQQVGGKIALRLPKSLHRQALLMAAVDGTSLNQFLVAAIAEQIGARQAGQSLRCLLHGGGQDG